MLDAEQVFDVNQRSEIYKRCQKLIFEDAELGSTYMSDQIMVYNKAVKDLRLQQFNVWYTEAWLDR